MDPSISWLQPEQDGPARRLWLRLWQTQQDLDGMNLKDAEDSTETLNNSINTAQNGVGKTVDQFGQSRASQRKFENRASTRGMRRYPHKIIEEYGGCLWRKPDFQYSRGVIGSVLFPYGLESPTRKSSQF